MSRRKKTAPKQLQDQLLAWYDRHQRVLPWRARAGKRPDPYHVWLSEIMLQQTTVITVGPYFRKFLDLFPTVQAMAKAPLDDVLAAWAGLGYYARARNLHKCAVIVARDYKGKFPDTVDALLDLPGIGPYTAAAISSIAFDQPAVAVDGNVERVVSRFFAIEEPLPASKSSIREGAAYLAEGVKRPGDFTQAFMELGATICVPRSPKCPLCPWQKDCAAHAQGIEETLPRKMPKKKKPERSGKVFWVTNGKRGNALKFLVEKKVKKGLYENMYLLPTTNWLEAKPTVENAVVSIFSDAEKSSQDSIRHVFTHFDLDLEIWQTQIAEKSKPEGMIWISSNDLAKYGFPSLMTKVIKRMLDDKPSGKQ